MDTNEYHNSESPCARVVCFGETTTDLVKRINSRYGSFAKAEKYDESYRDPSGLATKLKIAVVDEDIPDITSKASRWAEDLFLVMSTHDMTQQSDVQSMMFGSLQEIEQAVIAVLDTIAKPGYLSLDFNDVDKTLRNEDCFSVAVVEKQGEKALQEAVAQLKETCDIDECSRILVSIFTNPYTSTPIYASDMSALTAWMETLPTDAEVKWGMMMDETMSKDAVRVAVLSAPINPDFN